MAGKSPVRLQLTTLPVELLLRIYEVLPAFGDALRLRATCHTLHGMWTDHRTAIVNEIVLNQFECYPYARQLLANRRYGVPLDRTDLSDRDLSKLVRNARRVEEVVVNIEQKLVPGLKIDGLPEGKRSTIYGGNDVHPSTLTPTERLRVIRACYQIWSLTYCQDPVVMAKVHALRPRELFYLAELTEWARVTNFPSQDRWDVFQVAKAKRRALGKLYFATYGCQAPVFQGTGNGILDYDDPVYLFVIWDHWQDNLKSLICRRPLSNLRWDVQDKVLEHLWDYEPGDELLIVED